MALLVSLRYLYPANPAQAMLLSATMIPLDQVTGLAFVWIRTAESMRSLLAVQVVAGLRNTCLADAQSLTVLRAIQKGNAPGLIAGLAADTGGLYTEAGNGFRAGASQAGPAFSPKLAAYGAYKAACFNATALAFTGTDPRLIGLWGCAIA